MSYTYFFISKNKLDKEFISHLHDNGYSAGDFTSGIKDRKDGFYYYNVEPFTLYINRRSREIPNIFYREMTPGAFLIYFASALYKDEGFYFLYCIYDNNDVEKGYLHRYLESCTVKEITIEEFNEMAMELQTVFKVGTVYLVKP